MFKVEIINISRTLQKLKLTFHVPKPKTGIDFPLLNLTVGTFDILNIMLKS
jgi:hypothetical protein